MIAVEELCSLKWPDFNASELKVIDLKGLQGLFGT